MSERRVAAVSHSREDTPGAIANLRFPNVREHGIKSGRGRGGGHDDRTTITAAHKRGMPSGYPAAVVRSGGGWSAVALGPPTGDRATRVLVLARARSVDPRRRRIRAFKSIRGARFMRRGTSIRRGQLGAVASRLEYAPAR